MVYCPRASFFMLLPFVIRFLSLCPIEEEGDHVDSIATKPRELRPQPKSFLVFSPSGVFFSVPPFTLSPSQHNKPGPSGTHGIPDTFSNRENKPLGVKLLEHRDDQLVVLPQSFLHLLGGKNQEFEDRRQKSLLFSTTRFCRAFLHFSGSPVIDRLKAAW